MFLTHVYNCVATESKREKNKTKGISIMNHQGEEERILTWKFEEP